MEGWYSRSESHQELARLQESQRDLEKEISELALDADTEQLDDLKNKLELVRFAQVPAPFRTV